MWAAFASLLLLAAGAHARAPPGLESHPRPRTVSEARDLHEHALAATRKVMRRGRASVNYLGDMSLVVSGSAVEQSGFYRPSQGTDDDSKLGRTVNPEDYGADPSGKTDSTQAFAKATAAMFNASSRAPHKMASNITNFGGVTLDLSGGEYLLSAPVEIPTFVGNVHITGGTLRASTSFPSDRYLVEVGSAACKPVDGQGVCNEFIDIHDIFLDAAHVAAGGVVVYQTMGTTVGPSAFITGFNEVGVLVEKGHETIISDAWLAEYYWSDKHPGTTCVADGTGRNGSVGVEFNGEDNYMSNVIIFDYTCLGVLVNGAATTLDGVHSWNGGGVALSVDGSYDIQDRIVNCYLDYSTLQITNPKFVLCQGNFFYNAHTVLVGENLEGFVMRENIYSLNQYGGNESIVLQNAQGTAYPVGQGPGCRKVVVEDEIDAEQGNAPHRIYQTTATMTLAQKGASQWNFDFAGKLLLPRIDEVAYSLVLDPGVSVADITHAARTPTGVTVTVETSKPVTGSITMTVRQCTQ